MGWWRNEPSFWHIVVGLVLSITVIVSRGSQVFFLFLLIACIRHAERRAKHCKATLIELVSGILGCASVLDNRGVARLVLLLRWTFVHLRLLAEDG